MAELAIKNLVTSWIREIQINGMKFKGEKKYFYMFLPELQV